MRDSGNGQGTVARPLTDAQSRQTAAYKKSGVGHGSKETVVSTRQLAEIIEPLIQQLERELKHNQPDDEMSSGAIEAIDRRCSAIDGWGQGTAARRLWDIRNLRSRATKANSAEVLLMALDVSITDTELIQVPAGKVAARDRIDCWLELRGGEMSEADINEMVEDLLAFSSLVVHGREAVTIEEEPVELQLELVAA